MFLFLLHPLYKHGPLQRFALTAALKKLGLPTFGLRPRFFCPPYVFRSQVYKHTWLRKPHGGAYKEKKERYLSSTFRMIKGGENELLLTIFIVLNIYE